MNHVHPPLRLIALTGHKGVGKDSAAAALVRHLGYRSIAFADALRAEVAAAWRIDARMLTDRATKEYAIPALAIGACCEPEFVQRWSADMHDEPRSPRWIMQRWGDFQRERLSSLHYACIVVRWLKAQVHEGHARFVVTDARYLVELSLLRHWSPHLRVVQVIRPDLPPSADSHSSEMLGKTPQSYGLMNTGTLEDLVSATLRLEAHLYGGQEAGR